ncbi:hypothetical protein KDL29_06485 [bacterium]|nr:hypothetical protein [bacterium]
MSKAELLLVGAGPVGCMVASALVTREVQFDWFIRNPDVRKALQGLSVRFPDHTHKPDLSGAGFPEKIPGGIHNTVITCVKSQHTEHLLASLPLGISSRRLAIANGLINGDHHLGLLYGGAYLDGSQLVTRRSNILRVGSLGSIVDDSPWFCELLYCDWLATEAVTGIEVLQWHKLCLNCVVNPLTALLDVPNGRIMESLQSPLVQGLVHELQRVAHKHLGRRWSYTEADIVMGVQQLIEATIENSSSMREDLRHGRQPEISHMNGAIARLGREYGIPCPLNSSIAELVVSAAGKPRSRD